MKAVKDVAIILLNYNGSLDTIECVQSLNNMITDYKYDIYIWDNNSRKSEIDILKEYLKDKADFKICTENTFEKEKCKNNLLILSSDNLGFAGGNNKVIQ